MGRHSASHPQKRGRDGRRTSGTPTRRRKNEVRSVENVRTDDEFNVRYDSAPTRRSGSLERAPERLQNELNRRRHKTRRIGKTIALSLVALLLLAGVAGAGYYFYLQKTLSDDMTGTKTLDVGDLPKAEDSQPYNLLVMGYDRRKGDKQYRSDTMLLTRVDPQKKKIWMISLPRDYKTQIPGHGTMKLNAAYSLGQEKLAIKTVEKLTGQTINHYVGVDFNGFRKIVDAMGGIEINVPYKINDYKADYTKSKNAKKIDKGLQVLDGDHALVFVRTRAFPDADVTRMKNQQLFFKALADTAANKMSITQLPGVVTAAAPYISTDMSLRELLGMARDLKSAGSKNMYTTTLPGTWVSPYLVPDEEKKAEILKKFEEGVPFEETATEKKTTVKPADVTVTVRNGTTKPGLAKQCASILKTRGFVISDTGNTDQQNVYDKTMVIYKSSKADAQLVAKYLQSGVKIVESRGMYSFDSKVLVITGKDWNIEDVPVTDVKTE